MQSFRRGAFMIPSLHGFPVQTATLCRRPRVAVFAAKRQQQPKKRKGGKAKAPKQRNLSQEWAGGPQPSFRECMHVHAK